MGMIEDKIQQLMVEVNAFTTEIVAKLSRKAPSSVLSDNSTKLNNQTPAQMQTPVDTLINPHIARVNNPHSLTPALLEAYTPTEFADITDPLLRVGVLPLSQYGSLSSSTLPITYSGWGIVFGALVPVLIWGKSYSMPAQTVDITATIPTPAGKTLNVYVSVSNNVATYLLSETFLSETANRLFIGQVICGASAISSGDISKVTKLDNFRLGASPAGASIPTTTGLPTAVAAIDAGWKP